MSESFYRGRLVNGEGNGVKASTVIGIQIAGDTVADFKEMQCGPCCRRGPRYKLSQSGMVL